MIIIAALALLGFVTLAISAFTWRKNARSNLPPTTPAVPTSTPAEDSASRIGGAVDQLDDATRQIDDAFAQMSDGMNRTFADMSRTLDQTFERFNQAWQNPGNPGVNYTVTTRTVLPRVPPASRPQPRPPTSDPARAQGTPAAAPEVPVDTIFDHLRKDDESL